MSIVRVTTIGKMQKRIAIEQTSSVGDNQGGRTGESWVPFIASTWAEIQPKTGQARLEAQQTGTENPITISMRYKPGILPSMRVTYKTRHFKIVSVINPEEKNQYTVLECDEVSH